jgi:chromosome segregation protein
VHFQRLRLSGFKSFVDGAEVRIEPGVTGVVGPNGCGKSNLLESLRWVMGANSAKAMRAGEMDDVIFAGNAGRPSRNHAEVVLTIDNSTRRAPSQFNDHDVLEVSRRIDRGMGSTYRINGREVRARDVQLLFADASTGANSPALVRQGQISELIAAKPQNRRLILEEAAGVSGLHSRRHEAELRLRAAEANLTRLEDLVGELDSASARLRREARQAESYKRVSAEIRLLQSAVLHGRWSEAREGLERAEEETAEAARAVEATAAASAAATAEAIRADEAIKPLRDEEMAASAILHRLAVERDRLEHEAQRIEAEAERLVETLRRLDADRAREEAIIEDAKGALARRAEEIEVLKAEIAAAPERAPALEAAWKLAEAARTAAEAEVLRLSAEAAAEEARREAAASRVADAQARLARTGRALDMAKADRNALGPADDLAALAAKAKLADVEAALAAARQALEAAETERSAAAEAETAAREHARKAEDHLGRLKTEARGLAQLITHERKDGYKPALDQLSAERGFEAALAAALGDDLNAPLDRRAPAFWGGGAASAPSSWPRGVEPLAGVVRAPSELAARLAMTGLVAREDGDRIQPLLQPGMRLVSREGDLWRWDGFVCRAEAARPASVRLAQKARLEELENEIDQLSPQAKTATEAQARTAEALQATEAALRAARGALPGAEKAVALAREDGERHARESARRDARAQSLDETIARFETERAEAETAVAAAREDAAALPATDDFGPQLQAAREAAAAARESEAHARADLDQERREREGRQHRLEALERDAEDWTRRSEHAHERIAHLARDREATVQAQQAAREAPSALEEKKLRLLDELAAAETRLAAATDAFGAAEAERTAADRAARTAEQAASEARELRAGLAAKLDASRERLMLAASSLREAAQMEPEELGRTLADEAPAALDVQDVEQRLYALERQREAIGPVNLRAEEEAVEYAGRLKTLKEERADLTAAMAKLRGGIEELNNEGRERLLAAFDVINGHFQALFGALFGGGQAELRLIESDDPLEAGLEVFACPPGKRLSAMSLMSGGEQALTAMALIFGVFLAQPAPICVLDEVDAPLDDHNVDRFCNLLAEMRARTETRFICITHNPVTMSRMDRLYGVTMPERGVSQLVSVDLRQAEALAAE